MGVVSIGVVCMGVVSMGVVSMGVDIAMVGLVGERMQVVVGMHAGQSLSIAGHVSGDAGASPACEVIHC